MHALVTSCDYINQWHPARAVRPPRFPRLAFRVSGLSDPLAAVLSANHPPCARHWARSTIPPLLGETKVKPTRHWHWGHLGPIDTTNGYKLWRGVLSGVRNFEPRLAGHVICLADFVPRAPCSPGCEISLNQFLLIPYHMKIYENN